MSLNRRDVLWAITLVCRKNGKTYATLVRATEEVLPVLEMILENTERKQFLLRHGLKQLVRAIKDFVALRQKGEVPLILNKDRPTRPDSA